MPQSARTHTMQKVPVSRKPILPFPKPLTCLPFWDDKHSDHSSWMFPCGWWIQRAHILHKKRKMSLNLSMQHRANGRVLSLLAQISFVVSDSLSASQHKLIMWSMDSHIHIYSLSSLSSNNTTQIDTGLCPKYYEFSLCLRVWQKSMKDKMARVKVWISAPCHST